MPGTIGFLVFNGFELLDLAGPYEVFSVWGNKFNGPEKIVTIGQEIGDITSVNGLQIKSTNDFSNCPKLDYLVVAGGIGTKTEVNNERLIAFIQEVSKNCKAIISICTGIFLLQKAGLLDGKQATTHWALLKELRAFDKTTVIEKRIVKDEKIWSSGGVSSGIDLALAFIADISGEEIAGKVQAHMEYYPSPKLYGNFHNSEMAPQYLKRINQGSGGISSSFFQSKQNMPKDLDRPNVTAGPTTSAQSRLNNSTRRTSF